MGSLQGWAQAGRASQSCPLASDPWTPAPLEKTLLWPAAAQGASLGQPKYTRPATTTFPTCPPPLAPPGQEPTFCRPSGTPQA